MVGLWPLVQDVHKIAQGARLRDIDVLSRSKNIIWEPRVRSWSKNVALLHQSRPRPNPLGRNQDRQLVELSCAAASHPCQADTHPRCNNFWTDHPQQNLLDHKRRSAMYSIKAIPEKTQVKHAMMIICLINLFWVHFKKCMCDV